MPYFLYIGLIMDSEMPLILVTMHQASGASRGLLHILILFPVLFMQSLYTPSEIFHLLVFAKLVQKCEVVLSPLRLHWPHKVIDTYGGSHAI